jgi:hydrogenase/urease accessory protein HupE
MIRALVLVAALAVLAPSALAHEVRPAYLELQQTADDTYDVLWKVPARNAEERLALDVQFPDDCVSVSEPRGFFAGNAYTERYTIRRAGGLAGAEIRIAGLAATFTDALVRVETLDGTSQLARLSASSTSFVVEAAPGRTQVAAIYTRLGVEHILLGIDHLLFVLALIIATQGGWKLVKTVTAFTLSHSITLSLAALGVVHVPTRPVEATIALSIVFVASEIVRARRGHESIALRSPWVVAFTFGLLHGLGFAGALSDVGLPQTHIPVALVFFNIGIEMGHLLFVGVVLALLASLRRTSGYLPRWAYLVAPYAIGTMGTFWMIQRLLAL